jgi:two-component system chemotaxis response regulator CheY
MKIKKRVRDKGGVRPAKAKSETLGRILPDTASIWGPTAAAPGKNGIQILLVEDEQDHREALTILLEEEGYEVSSATDGLEAIERIRWGMRPNAILLDMRMHVMNGWEFRRELGKDPGYRSTPVLIMSGAPLRPEDLSGCAGWIPKPVQAADLLKKLAQITGVSTQAPSHPR